MSPLSALTNLELLDLYDNEIVDVGPLSALTSLTAEPGFQRDCGCRPAVRFDIPDSGDSEFQPENGCEPIGPLDQVDIAGPEFQRDIRYQPLVRIAQTGKAVAEE